MPKILAALTTAAIVLSLLPARAEAQGDHTLPKVAYRGNLSFVFGDVKQAFIRDRLTDNRQVDNLLDGFAAMRINGIRIPIMTDSDLKDRPQLDYLVAQAKARGFVLFANPAQSGGGRLLANGTILDNAPVIDKPDKAGMLVERVEAFAKAYKVDYIDPFNEDGPPNGAWSAEQMNSIYKNLRGHLEGAQLVGPCTWGIKAGIKILSQTDIKDDIAVATTHNLAYEHELWPAFMRLAQPLPVWDSETTDYAKFPDKPSRAQAAIDAGVNGIVFYDSWRDVSLANGAVNRDGLALEQLWLR